MKTIGLIGGMSWESTAHYYTELNQGIKTAMGGLHSAKILMYSVDFAPIEKLQTRGDWESLGDKNRLVSNFDLDVIIPDEKDRKSVHAIIFEELCLGQIKSSSKKDYINIAKRMVEKGARGIILGCTEIGMLLKPEDIDIPLYDTTKIHAAKAVEWALRDE